MTTPKTPQEAMEMLDALGNDDREEAHCEADAILWAALRLAGPDFAAVADAFERACDRIGFWYA